MGVAYCSFCDTFIDIDYDPNVFFCESCLQAVCSNCIEKYGYDCNYIEKVTSDKEKFYCPECRDNSHLIDKEGE